MCNFFSCCVDKKGKVYWEPGINNHHEIVEIFKLNDNTDNQLELKFARVEITPKDGDIFNKNIDNWGLRIDENIIPEWFSPMHEKQCLSTLEKCLADCVFSDITIAEIKDKKGLYLKNVVVQRMYGSSVVQEMYDSSTCMIYSKNASFTIKSEFSVVICRINNNIIIHKGENYGS